MSKKIRLAIVTSLPHHSQGGPATAVRKQFHALSPELDVTVFGVATAQQRAEVEQALPGSQIFPLTWPHRWFRSTGLADALWRALPAYDIVHAHMLWEHPVWAAWRAARALRKPLIITPHGLLMEPWRYQSWHKQLYRRLLLDKMLRTTTFLQVLSLQEAQACRQAGVTTPIRVIPNGLEAVEFHSLGSAERALARWPVLTGKRVLIYLGRLWEGKGVGELITAWAQLCHADCTTDWHLVLAGPDYRGYHQQLIVQRAQLGIQERVSLLGEVTSQTKADLFALGAGFVLPSWSEGLSCSLLEAMAAGLPAVYTQGCHFPILAQQAGGIEVPSGAVGVQAGLRTLLHMDDNSRRQMGSRARELAQRSFTMEQVATELRALYQEAIQQQNTS